MEQEQVVAQLGRATLVTGEVILKGLFLVCSKGVEIYQARGENVVFTGETDWNKFMATADVKEVQQLLHNEVNLEAVRKELGQYGIGFSFYTHPDGKTTLAFNAKDKGVVEQAFKDVLEGITRDPKGFNDRNLKNGKTTSFEEKLKYFKAVEQEKVTSLQVNIHTKEFVLPENIEPQIGGKMK